MLNHKIMSTKNIILQFIFIGFYSPDIILNLLSLDVRHSILPSRSVPKGLSVYGLTVVVYFSFFKNWILSF